ncbi:hypothetical protein L841_1062 [Mycobacterium sp. MAC_080597_8934]|nr:hypothetical protein L841_1062 [Mycobacterium sp. MAC_080597_8934]
MGHLFRTAVVKLVTASLRHAKETTMTIPITGRGALCTRAAGRGENPGNGCAARD